MNNEYSITVATFPDKGAAKSIAKLLVENRFAACVQMFPIESMYIWQDKVCDENEGLRIGLSERFNENLQHTTCPLRRLRLVASRHSL